MIGNPQEMRALTQDLTSSGWTLSAIGALLESGLVEHLREPRTVEELAAVCPALTRGRIARCLAVTALAGVVSAEGNAASGGARFRLAPGAVPFSEPAMRTVLKGDIRASLMQMVALLDAARDERGTSPSHALWRHTDPALLQAQGDASSMFAPAFKANMVASMGDLAARLERPGARFLDVGVGVASLTIAMSRCFPTIHSVGVDSFDAPLALAKQNVERAQMGDRIELRKMAIEDLRDEEAFDLAWVPSVFIPLAVLPAALVRVRASLRPGAWMLFPIGGSVADERAATVFALVNELWGGPVLSIPEAESILKEAGFSSVRTLPGPGWAPPMIAAQR